MYQVIYKKHKETGKVLYYCYRLGKICWDEEVEEAHKYDEDSNTIDEAINNFMGYVDESWILGKKKVGVSEWERNKNNYLMVKIKDLESIYSVINESLRRLVLPISEASYTKEEIAKYLKHAEKQIIPFIRGDQSKK